MPKQSSQRQEALDKPEPSHLLGEQQTRIRGKPLGCLSLLLLVGGIGVWYLGYNSFHWNAAVTNLTGWSMLLIGALSIFILAFLNQWSFSTRLGWLSLLLLLGGGATWYLGGTYLPGDRATTIIGWIAILVGVVCLVITAVMKGWISLLP